MVACHGHTKTDRSQQLSAIKVTELQERGSGGLEDRGEHHKFKCMNWKALLRMCMRKRYL